jgi:hypothetical protein
LEEVASDAFQDEAFEASQVIKSIVEGLLNSGIKGIGGVGPLEVKQSA